MSSCLLLLARYAHRSSFSPSSMIHAQRSWVLRSIVGTAESGLQWAARKEEQA